MKLCLLGDFSGKPDEGMKNISRTIRQMLSLKHSVLSLNSKDIFKKAIICNLRVFQPEIVHYIQGPTIRSLIILKFVKMLLGNKPVTIVSATKPYFSKYSRWAVRFLKTDLILSQSVIDENFFKRNGFKVKFFPNGVDCKKFSPATEKEKLRIRHEFNLPENKIIVLHVGHIKANRNLELFREIQKGEHFQVVVVGGTTVTADEILKNDLQRSGIKVFHKYYDDISIFYKMTDLYVFPVKDTGEKLPDYYNQVGAIDIPLSVLEAMACNLPVITSTFNALPRIFKAGDGLTFCLTNSEIVNAVKGALRCGFVNTRRKVLPYHWDRVIQQLEQVYRSSC
jgi:glycosyltransferase involved in cell wall biosynthesis